MDYNISLKPFTTMAIDAKAKNFITVDAVKEVQSYLKSNFPKPLLVLGGGSNMVFLNDYEGTILHNQIKGIETVNETQDYVVLKVGAGENWHEFVLYTLSKNYGGLENLSLIPGNVGASPVQNIGAYGVEIKDNFVELEAIEIATGKIKSFSKEDCRFGYRESIFKNELKGKYIITSVTYQFTKNTHQIKTGYGAIQQELYALGIENPTIHDVSNAVIRIRQSKLPNPKEIPNCGSFFKNPTIQNVQFDALRAKFPKMPGYAVGENQTKIPAGWLIDFAGWKGFKNETVGVHAQQALVLINHNHGTGKDIYNLSEKIILDIDKKFGIQLEREVNII